MGFSEHYFRAFVQNYKARDAEMKITHMESFLSLAQVNV
jgi:hypothetical protein